jgi:hypothetical protein
MSLPIGSQQTQDFGPDGFASLSQPMFWREKALALRRAADVLWTQVLLDGQSLREQLELVKAGKLTADDFAKNPPSISGQYALLAAYALENLLKARIIGVRGRIEPSSELAKELVSHDLATLASRAKIDLTEDEQVVLEMLTEASVVSGRYPIPKRSEQVVAHRYLNYDALHPVFNALFERLLVLVEQNLLVPARGVGMHPLPAG